MKKRSLVKLILCLLPLMVAFFSLGIISANADNSVAYPFRTGINAFENGKEVTISHSGLDDYTEEKVFVAFTPSVEMDNENGYLALQLESKLLAQVQFHLFVSNTAGTQFVTFNIPESAVYLVSETGAVSTDENINGYIDIPAGFKGMIVFSLADMDGDVSDVNWQGYSRLFTTIDARWHNGLDFKYGELGYYADSSANITKFLDLSDANNGGNIVLEVSNTSSITSISKYVPTYAFKTGENAFAYGAKWDLGPQQPSMVFTNIAYFFDSQFVEVDMATDYIAVQIGTERAAWLQPYILLQIKDTDNGVAEYKSVAGSGTVYLMNENGNVVERPISYGSIVLNAGDRGALIIPLSVLSIQYDVDPSTVNFSNAWQFGMHTHLADKFGYNINVGEVGLYKGDFNTATMTKITTLNSEADYDVKIHLTGVSSKTMIAEDAVSYPFKTGTDAFKGGIAWSKPTQAETAGSYTYFHSRFAAYHSVNKDEGYLAIQIATDNSIAFKPYVDVLAVGGQSEVRYAATETTKFVFVNEDGTVENLTNSYSSVIIPGPRVGMLLVELSTLADLYATGNIPHWDFVCVIGLIVDGYREYNPAFNLFLGDMGFYAGDYKSSQLTKIGSKYNDSIEQFGTQFVTEATDAGSLAPIGNTYRVTFKNEDGSDISSNLYLEGATITAPEAIKPSDGTYNYTFAGWDSEVTAVDCNKTYTATYTSNLIVTGITASYSGNIIQGNKIDPSKISLSMNYANNSSEPINAGIVEYWYQDLQIQDPINYVFEVVGPLDIIVKYNGFEATMRVNVVYEDFEISYDLVDGEVATANPVEYNKGTETFTLVNPTKVGYTFAGWTGTDLDEATLVVTITQGSSGDRSYVATWTINTYTVIFNSDGGSAVESETVEYNTTVAEPTAPTKAGYTFEGWYVGQTEFDFDTLITEDVTLIAKWTEVSTGGNDNDGGDATPPVSDSDSDSDDVTPPPTNEDLDGCGSSIVIGAVIPSVIAILGAGIIVKAKKKD